VPEAYLEGMKTGTGSEPLLILIMPEAYLEGMKTFVVFIFP